MFRGSLYKALAFLFPSVTWKVKTSAQAVYLTFDDGPHPTITPWVLEELEKYEAKATFFCVGDNVRKYPETYTKIIERGHATGNHTFNHIKGWETSNLEYKKNIDLAGNYIESDLFRPPYGRITLSQIKLLKAEFKIVMWSVLTRDYEKNLNVELKLKNVFEMIEPGAIVVLHDSEKAENNLKMMLPAILEHCMKKGFTCEKLESRIL